MPRSKSSSKPAPKITKKIDNAFPRLVQPSQFNSVVIEFDPKTKNQATMMKMLEKFDINFVIGSSGVGKSYCSVAYALKNLLARKIEKIVVARPYITCGKDTGALPGDIKEKWSVLMCPIMTIFEEFLGKNLTEQFIDVGKIEVAPLQFVRGTTYRDAVVIITEAQNLNKVEMNMALSRIGENTTIICEGDLTQSDLPINVKSGLQDVLNRIQGEPDFGFIKFTSEDCVRSQMAKRVIEIYEKII